MANRTQISPSLPPSSYHRSFSPQTTPIRSMPTRRAQVISNIVSCSLPLLILIITLPPALLAETSNEIKIASAAAAAPQQQIQPQIQNQSTATTTATTTSPTTVQVNNSSSSAAAITPTATTTATPPTAPTPSLANILRQDEQVAGNSSAAKAQPAAAVQLDQLVLDPSSQMIANGSESPKSDKQQVIEMFNKFFIHARSHDDQQQKEFVRDGVILRLRDLGFETSFLQKSRFEFRRRPAYSYNMISILPGRYRQTKRDRIVLIGAHWDSATKAPGVDDNGSGSTCLLEIARLISENRCSFNHTVMLVWFDYEEQGKFGSEFFVNDYLFPLELEKYGSKFIGAYVLDMILVRDKEFNTQTLPLNLKTRLPEFSDEIEREKFRGDFLATWARKTWDEPLEAAFRGAWTELGYESRTFKAMRPELPQTRLPNSEERYDWKDFFRSDHASFWYPPLTSTAVRRSPNRTSTAGHTSLNAILLTDLGPWRKSYQKCYHSACDDEHLLTEGNLAFMQQVIDSLLLTLLRVGQGNCSRQQVTPTRAPPPPGPISNSSSSSVSPSSESFSGSRSAEAQMISQQVVAVAELNSVQNNNNNNHHNHDHNHQRNHLHQH